MTTALAERPPTTLGPVVTHDQLDLIRRTVANGATADELKLYLYDCARRGIHPLDKLLHFTKRGGKYTPVTSIDLMRTRAADTGEYAGSDRPVFEGQPKDDDWTAIVTVYRIVQGQRCPFVGEARWSEYKPAGGQDHMWQKMPHTMLAKCAEAIALRKGFPQQLAGLYASEELDQAPTDVPRHVNVRTGEIVEPLVRNAHAASDDPADLPMDDQLRIIDVRTEPFTSKTGNAVTRYHVTFSDGRTAQTVDYKLGALVTQIADEGQPIQEPVIERTKWGVDLKAVQRLAPLDADPFKERR